MARPRDPTQFTRESAERIANVVRAAELATPGARPLNFEREDFFRNAKIFRVGVFQGPWPINTPNIVSLTNVNTPQTVVALNLFFPITRPNPLQPCAIAKEGPDWYLIDVRMATASAVFAGTTTRATVFGTGSTSIIRFLGTNSTSRTTILSGVSASFDAEACSVSVTTQGTSIITFSMSGTQTAVAVSMAGTQTITLISSTFTASFLTLA